MALIIVESPTKARTFNRILKGKDFFVFATMGHIRDLPGKSMSINFKNNFEPKYEIIAKKTKAVQELRKLASEHQEIILATDPDREGESISYHVAYLLGLINEDWPNISFIQGKEPKRIVFHEITPNALKEALEKPESLRLDLVKAQQARRILDRLVGYELSPLLWKKMGKNWLSAGRVQSVALRLIVEREKEIRAFKTEDYYQLFGVFKGQSEAEAKLIAKSGVPYEQSFKLQLFAGEYQYTKTTIDESSLPAIKTDLLGDLFKVDNIEESVQTRFPPPPFTTSLLQQGAFQKFGFSSKMTMRLAQDLYERGLITYHRTDSFNLSTQFVFRAKDYIEKTYGKDYSLEKPRGFRTKSKNAQEAHEAIRPTKVEKEPSDVEKDKKITLNHKRLYKLIFDRAVATQMKEASVRMVKVHIKSKKEYEFVSEYQKVLFDGFFKILNPEFASKNQGDAPFKNDESLVLVSQRELATKTKAPPRYNEASLIKILEEKGIGRPSTYAPIISLIQDKNYVIKESRYFVPTKLGEAISEYLSKNFPNVFNLDFTAEMEQKLDEIAQGNIEFISVLSTFYGPFEETIKEKKKDKELIDVEERVDEKCPKCGSQLVVRYSRFGKFMACSNYPTCKFTKPFLQFVPNKFCPKCNGRIVVRFTKSRKRFFGCENYPKCDYSSWKLNSTTYDRKDQGTTK